MKIEIILAFSILEFEQIQFQFTKFIELLYQTKFQNQDKPLIILPLKIEFVVVFFCKNPKHFTL